MEPPYSEGFARAMLAIMERSMIARLRSSALTPKLRAFAAGCVALGLGFVPGLPERHQLLLEELCV